MAKNDASLEARIRQIIHDAVTDAVDSYREGLMVEVTRSFGAAPGGVVARRRDSGDGLRAVPRSSSRRTWPVCSVPGCGKTFFGPSGSARFCYEHYLQSGGQHPAHSSGTPPPRAAAAPRGAPPRGGKTARAPRTADASVVEQLLAFIKGSPGLRSEQIQKQVGFKQAIVKAGLAKLRASGRVKTTGSRRSTTYAAP